MEPNRDSKSLQKSKRKSWTSMLFSFIAPIAKISGLGFFIFIAILTMSLFAYIAFYQAVVPEIQFDIPLNFHFE